MVYRLFFLLIAATLIFLPADSYAMEGRIAVVVNSDAISASDVNDRMKLMITSSGLRNSEEIKEKLEPQIVSVLVEEQIKLQEARRLGIKVTEEEVQDAFASIAQNNNRKPSEFKRALEKSGINLSTLYRQIRSQIAWGKVIGQKLRPQVTVRDKDVQAALDRMKNNIGKTEYLLAEIFLPVENPGEEKNIRQLAERLSQQIRGGQAPFFQVARQFSQSAGAAQGGDVGWVQEGQLAPEINEALPDLELNKASKPIKTVGGYHILLVRDKRDITEESIPSSQAMTNNIGMERLDRLQRRYLMDLKASAFIESRV